MIWRQLFDGFRKNRVVVDIKSLNKITKSDFYLLSLQSDIIFAVTRFSYIFIVNENGYFYQFLVRYKDRYKFIIIFHREQKQYNVAFMKYKKSSPYVQRQTNKIFKFIREFVKAYVNDMIVFLKTLSKYLNHLRKMFTLFRQKRINLNFKKSFLNYFFVILFGQRVDSLSLFTFEKKLAIITTLRFLKTLR